MTEQTPTDAQQYLNVASQCAATATSELAKNVLVDDGSGTLRELLNDAADAIRAGWGSPVVAGEPFGYFHQLLDHECNGNGVWLGTAKREVTEQAHTPGETGEEIVTLYTTPQAALATQPSPTAQAADSVLEDALIMQLAEALERARTIILGERQRLTAEDVLAMFDATCAARERMEASHEG